MDTTMVFLGPVRFVRRRTKEFDETARRERSVRYGKLFWVPVRPDEVSRTTIGVLGVGTHPSRIFHDAYKDLSTF